MKTVIVMMILMSFSGCNLDFLDSKEETTPVIIEDAVLSDTPALPAKQEQSLRYPPVPPKL
jgi:hypothetical protein